MKKYLLLLAAMLFGHQDSFSQNIKEKVISNSNKNDTITFNVNSKDKNSYVDQVPIFPGSGNSDANLSQYFKKNLVYPVDAKSKKISGVVSVSFVIEENGRLTNIRISKKVYPSIDKEAIRLIKGMPMWSPAMLHDRPVKCNWAVDIPFRL